MGVGMPLRMDGIEGVREDGKEDKEACRFRLLLPLAIVPLVEGRYDRTDAMVLGGGVESIEAVKQRFRASWDKLCNTVRLSSKRIRQTSKLDRQMRKL